MRRIILIALAVVLTACTQSGVAEYNVDCTETATGGYDCTTMQVEPYSTPTPQPTYTPYPTYTPRPTPTINYFPRTEVLTLDSSFDEWIGPDSQIYWTQPNNFRSDMLDWEGRQAAVRIWESGVYTFTASWISDTLWVETNVVVNSPIVPQSIGIVGTPVVTMYTPTPTPIATDG